MATFYNRLSGKFILALLFFLFILGTATAAVITAGFRQTQATATDRSVQALQAQGRDTLLQVTRREAQLSAMQLNQALSLGRAAADFYTAAYYDHHVANITLGPLQQAVDGGIYDPNPERITDVWIDPSVTLTAGIEENLRRSHVLDELFPALMAQSADVIAIYFMDPNGATRYYPRVDVANIIDHELIVTEHDFFRLATPTENPERKSVWTRPYMDYIGKGPIVTAATPVYVGDEFIGVISVDVSLTRLIERLNQLTPTPRSYALIVDSEGRLVAAPPAALDDLLSKETVRLIAQLSGGERETAHVIEFTMGLPLRQVGNEAFQQTLANMRSGASGLSQFELADRDVFLSYVPLPEIGWSLAVVAPIAEITAQSQAVASAIRNEAGITVRWTLWITTLFFGLALVATVTFTRRFLTIPIERLVAATQKVAAGESSVSLPIHAQDELGLLADSFNRMTDQIVQAQQTLEARVSDRTRELSALYAVTTVASRSLDQETVLNTSLNQVLAVMNCTHGMIHLWDDAEQALKLAVHCEIPEVVLADMQRVEMSEGLIGWVAEEAAPLVLDDIAADPRIRLPRGLERTSNRGFVGVPMYVKNRTIGVLSVIGAQGRRFNGEEVKLLNSIADQVAVAVENARLYEQAEQLAVVEERQRLARELHDSVTQSLYSVNLLSETARRAAAGSDLDRVSYLMDRVGEMARQALKEMRLLVYELRPAALAQEGLVGALQQRIDTVEARAGVKAQLRIEGDPLQIPQQMEAHLYRIAQEALNNALKHAEATMITVLLQIEDNGVTLTIQDNGKGFELEHANESGGIGLKSMHERAQQLSGVLHVQTKPGGGVSICVCLPLKQSAAPIKDTEPVAM
ncbi:GAF domain-containing protein [bacterium]|nr:GAF domain-containing protein [bacterium]